MAEWNKALISCLYALNVIVSKDFSLHAWTLSECVDLINTRYRSHSEISIKTWSWMQNAKLTGDLYCLEVTEPVDFYFKILAESHFSVCYAHTAANHSPVEKSKAKVHRLGASCKWNGGCCQQYNTKCRSTSCVCVCPFLSVFISGL